MRQASLLSDLAHFDDGPQAKVGRTSRDRATDAGCCLLAALLGALFLSPELGDDASRLPTWQLFLDLCCGASGSVLLWWRRRWPFGVALACLVLGTVSISVTPAGLIALFSLAVHRPFRPALLVALLWVPSVLIFAIYSGTTDATSVLLVVIPIVLAVTAWGMYAGARRQLLLTLRERAQRAEADQVLREERTRLAERTRIAR
jgi:hypothetical protein